MPLGIVAWAAVERAGHRVRRQVRTLRARHREAQHGDRGWLVIRRPRSCLWGRHRPAQRMRCPIVRVPYEQQHDRRLQRCDRQAQHEARPRHSDAQRGVRAPALCCSYEALYWQRRSSTYTGAPSSTRRSSCLPCSSSCTARVPCTLHVRRLVSTAPTAACPQGSRCFLRVSCDVNRLL